MRLRGEIWQIDVVTQSGERIRQSSGTSEKAAAQELHDKIKYELWRIGRIGEKPKYLWDDAAIRWLKEKAHKKSLDDDKIKIKLLTQFRGKYLDDLSRDFIMSVINGLSCADSTKNRYISLIRAILKKCEGEWEWIDKAPTLTAFKEKKKRIRWLKPEEAERLIGVLPDVIAEMAQFSLLTGLRQGNVLGLEWSQVDLNRQVAWIHPDQAKAEHAIGVPLNHGAMLILEGRQGIDSQYVFTKANKPINGISSKVWKRALKEAGIIDFRWHDLRHTWASWLVQAGVPLLDLKEMGGWESIEMVQKYAHLAPDHLHKHAVHVDKINVTNTAQKNKALNSVLGGVN
ncbi:tyrosine-type recombinase/integrase [Neisseria sp. Ec49-e6-T10]|uniref:tyrosine-type recombinase/integrase n=1 Tax=Neisseria sp. Ec49-e6-T10 TaxID=3140744 RepID=UPI003EBD7BCE